MTCWGHNEYGETTAPTGRFVAIAAGNDHSCGLRPNGTAECWGNNERGQLAPPDDRFSEIEGGGWHTCGLRLDRTVACWGGEIFDVTEVPAGRFLAVSSGGVHACGIREDGTAVCWGFYDRSHRGLFSDIAGGGSHTCAVSHARTIECWGRDEKIQTDAPIDPGSSSLWVRLSASTPSRTSSGTPFDLQVDFARPVSGFSSDDITVVNGDVQALSGAGSTYRATIVPSASGTVVVRVPRAAAFDTSGNFSAASQTFARTAADAGTGAVIGFDTWNREAVVASVGAEMSREEPDPEFTGDVADCRAGTTSQRYRDSVMQRLNWYRAMAGTNPLTENREALEAAQEAALMMSANGQLSHSPGSNWTCYSQTGADAAGRSNLGLGGHGIEGIDHYIQERGAGNLRVGHRRWILLPTLAEVATGNAPEGPNRAANALTVVGMTQTSTRDVREQREFVAWPPAGYVPREAVWGRWSFTLPGADFSAAAVEMSDDFGPLEVQIIDRGTFLEPGIVWALNGDTDSNLFPQLLNGDHCLIVRISGIGIDGTAQAPYEYMTCVLNDGDLDRVGSE